MAITILQMILTALACAGLWWFWSRLPRQGKAALIIAAGFLLRAMAGQILFWISWLHLPVARSLQLGNGFWFFATDGPGYLSYADELIGRGLKATVFATAVYPSHVFVQVFTTFAALFGTVASIAILLNCAAFLGTCAIITRIGDARAELPRLVALTAIAFGPGTILWSLQPLKDTFFMLLITALIGVCYRWQELLLGGERSPRRLLGWAALMLLVVYCIAGLRWYFAATTCGACVVFFTLIAIRVRPKWRQLATAAVLLLLLSQAFRIGGDDDVPRWARRLVDPRPVTTTRWYPITVKGYVQATRRGFDSTPGATMIAPGPALAAARVVSKSTEATKRVRAGEVLTASKVMTAEKPAPAPIPKTTPVSKRIIVPKTAGGAPFPTPALATTLMAGSSAMFLPRMLGQALGLIRIGGGRGFWFFVEIDTLVFDAVLLFAGIYCARALRSGARITPLFIFVFLLLVLTAAPMIYAVSNFGTLFRLRQMVYLLIALLPLTLATDARVRP